MCNEAQIPIEGSFSRASRVSNKLTQTTAIGRAVCERQRGQRKRTSEAEPYPTSLPPRDGSPLFGASKRLDLGRMVTALTVGEHVGP